MLQNVSLAVGILLGVVLILGAVVGAVVATVRIMRNYITSRVNADMADTIAKKVNAAIGPQLATIQQNQIGLAQNQREVSDAVGRVQTLENAFRTEIRNGITDRQNRLEKKLDRIIEHAMGWDGTERRESTT